MALIKALKNKIGTLLSSETSVKSASSGVHVSVEELVKEQYNILGLDFFKTSSRNITAGANSSPFKGKGMEFDEVRAYQAGDDVRSIDWRVTARKGDTYTKLFREERERQVIILTDMQQTMHFGTRAMFKSVMAAKVAALIGWAALDASEKVGGIVVSEKNTEIVRPQRSSKSMLAIINALSKASFVKEGDNHKSMPIMLSELRKTAKTGGIVFIISDFYDFNDTVKSYLTQIAGKCDVVLINIFDRLEEKAPPEDRYLVTDGKQTLTLFADDYTWREQYELYFKQKKEKIEDFCKKRAIKCIAIRTDENPAKALKIAFSNRRKGR